MGTSSLRLFKVSRSFFLPLPIAMVVVVWVLELKCLIVHFDIRLILISWWFPEPSDSCSLAICLGWFLPSKIGAGFLPGFVYGLSEFWRSTSFVHGLQSAPRISHLAICCCMSSSSTVLGIGRFPFRRFLVLLCFWGSLLEAVRAANLGIVLVPKRISFVNLQ